MNYGYGNRNIRTCIRFHFRLGMNMMTTGASRKWVVQYYSYKDKDYLNTCGIALCLYPASLPGITYHSICVKTRSSTSAATTLRQPGNETKSGNRPARPLCLCCFCPQLPVKTTHLHFVVNIKNNKHAKITHSFKIEWLKYSVRFRKRSRFRFR